MILNDGFPLFFKLQTTGIFRYDLCLNYFVLKLCQVHCNQAISTLRFTIAFSAFRTFPVNSLYAEANEPFLNLRRKKLSLQYYIKLKSNPDNPTYKVVFEPLYKNEFIEKAKFILSFSLRCEADMNCIDVDLEDVVNHKIPEVPLWTSKKQTYNYYLTSDKKATRIK